MVKKSTTSTEKSSAQLLPEPIINLNSDSLEGEQSMEEVVKTEVQEEVVMEAEVQEVLEETNEQQVIIHPDAEINQSIVDEAGLKIEDLVLPGRFGVTNSQLIPAIKKAIAENAVENLKLLKSTYLYTFANSLKYLKKTELEYLTINLK